jgi:hypothetical protein
MKFRIGTLTRLAFLAGAQQALATSVVVRGAVNKQLNLSVPDLKRHPFMSIR